MRRLTPEENRFLDVFLHEATTALSLGRRRRPLPPSGLEYGDISRYIAWAYEQDVPRTCFAVGHAADAAPPIPWPNRQSAVLRNQEIQRAWERRQHGGEELAVPNEGERHSDVVDEVGTHGHPGGGNSR